jgi:peptide/nickel transport system substrate-binding protein
VDLAALTPTLHPSLSMRRTMRSPLLLLAPVLLALGCDTGGRTGGGTIIISAAADVDALIPPLRVNIGSRMVSELLFDPLVELGPDRNPFGDASFVPRLASRWKWSADSLVLTFSLDPAARWHDGQPVVAQDVVAGLAAVREPAHGSTLLSDITEIDSARVIDARTVALHFNTRSSEQVYAASLVFPLPSHLVDTIAPGTLPTSGYAQRPVGSGQYRFVSREPTVRLELAAVDDHYRGRPLPDRIALLVSKEPSTAIAKLWAEEADVFEALPPPDVAEAAKHPHVRLVRTLGFDYSFVAYNFRDPRDTTRAHPLLADEAMRRALTHAIDRTGIVRALFDTLARPAIGPMARAQFAADSTLAHPAFDTARANVLLDSLGWRTRGADGLRRRNGRTLTLRALVPSPSASRVRASVIVQEQFRAIGVDMPIDKLDGQAFSAARDAGRFDLVFGGYGTTPSMRGIRGTWGSRAHAGWGRLNSGNYADPGFDAAVEAGLGALDPDSARAHFRAAFRIIADDVPAIWLYEVTPVAAVHARFTLPDWRPEAWWRTIPAWRLERARALPRDVRPLTD